MPLFLKSFDPTVDIFGNNQIFRFNNSSTPSDNDGGLSLVNMFAPTATTKALINLDFVNSSFKGFRFQQESSLTSIYGNFSLQAYSKFGTTSDIFKYDEQTNTLNFLKNTSILGSALASQAYVDNHNWLSTDITDFNIAVTNIITPYNYSTKVYVDAHTWLSSSITDLATTVKAYTLNSFALPTVDLNLNSKKITSLSNGTIATDAINLGQLQALGLSSLTTNGFLTRIAANSYLNRTIAVGTGLGIANADGVAGNPTLSLTNSGVVSGSYTNVNATVDSYGRITSISNGSSSGTITLTGAITGSGSLGSSISTSLNSIQSINNLLAFETTTNTVANYDFRNSLLGTPYGRIYLNFKKTTTNGDVRQFILENAFDSNQAGYTNAFSLGYKFNSAYTNIFTYQSTLNEFQFYCLTSFDAGVSLKNNNIQNVGNPILAQDAATKAYVDSAIVTPILPSVMHGYLYNNQSTNIATGDHIKFDNAAFTRGTAITLDTFSTYSNAANTASIGRITLAAGKTYKLTAIACTASFASTSAYLGLKWHNNTTNTPLGTVNTWWGGGFNYTSGGAVVAYITTTVSTRVELRINNVLSLTYLYGTSDSNSATWFTVEEI